MPTIASTLKTASLFKNHLHKHIDQVDGNDFQGRLVRPGEPIRNVVKHDTEMPEDVQRPYDNFMYSWKNSQRLRMNNEIGNIEELRKR